MNDKQRLIVAIIAPIIVILIGCVVIGSRYSTSISENAITFNPIRYFSKNGIGWVVVFLIIGILEYFWWKDRDTKK